MKCKEYEIIPLPKAQWEGVPIPMRYTTGEHYAVEVEKKPEGYIVSLVKRKLDAPITHYPEEYDFPDRLYQPHWEKASAWGIVEEQENDEGEEGGKQLLACIESCPEEWSNRLIVTELWVHETLRRQGVAHTLMAIVKEQAAQEGRRAIILETQSCNVGAIAFYHKEGFELIGFDSCCYSNRDIVRKEVRLDLGYFLEEQTAEELLESGDGFCFGKAAPEDKGEILSLYRSLVGTEYCAWTDDYPSETEIESDLSRDALFCMKDGSGKIIGTISIDQDEAVENLPCWSKKLEPAGELSRLGVCMEYQNRGVARQLLQYGMEELRRRGYKSVHFLVCKTNRKAIRSYDKLNFDVAGECRLFGEEWLCYEKSFS